MKEVKVKQLVFSKDKANICVSIMDEDQKAILEKAKQLKQTHADVVEWRCDYYREYDNVASVVATLRRLVAVLDGMPLIFTFRTLSEGGMRDLDASAYVLLYKAVLLSRLVDFIDIGMPREDGVSQSLIKHAKSIGVKVILSNHDFSYTPPMDKIITRLQIMKDRGADICKIAYMPRNEADVQCIEAVAKAMRKQDILFIAISMGELGERTRRKASMLGSCLSFAFYGEKSAPGQVDVEELYHFLQ